MTAADVLPRAVDLLSSHTALLAKQTPSPKRSLPERPDLPPAKRARMVKYTNYVPEEETIRNDYSMHYVDTGEWPQNYVQGAELDRRFEEYPKQRRLLQLKKEAVSHSAHPPTYLPFPLAPNPSSTSSLLTCLTPLKFDVIVLDPFHSSHTWTWDDLISLPVPQLAADPSFVFMWVGNGSDDGLEKGREVLARWGYRRAEDIVWIRTNKEGVKGPGGDEPTSSLLTHTKQHCLMGIRGTVRRSTDAWFVHCNIDTDVIIWEGDPEDPTRKPPELYSLIENFCMGMRRLELFGRMSSLRPGWLTAGEDFERVDQASLPENAVHWTLESYESNFTEGVRSVVPNSGEIESLRPKSPTRGNASGPTLLAPPPNAQRAVPRPAPGQPMPSHFPHSNQSQGIPLGQQPRPMQPMQASPMLSGAAMGQPMSIGMMAQGGPNYSMLPQQEVFGIGMGPPGMPQQGMQGMGMLNGGMGMGMIPGMHGAMGGMPQAMQGMGAMHQGLPVVGMPGMGAPGMGGMSSMGSMGGMNNMGGLGMPLGMGMGNMNMAGMAGMGNMGIPNLGNMGNMAGMGMGMNIPMNMPGMQSAHGSWASGGTPGPGPGGAGWPGGQMGANNWQSGQGW